MSDRPNFVYIFCDELRPDLIGCYAPEAHYTHTPNIDRLAREGIRYDHCFCNCPTCVPSRASLLTGMYPTELGVYHNESSIPPFEMPVPYKTFPAVLRENGYATASFGKTHLPWRMDSGFAYENSEGSEMSLGLPGFSTGGVPSYDAADGLIQSRGVVKNVLGGVFPEGTDSNYLPKAITRNTIDWMKSQTGPFFVRAAYLQPHTPVIAPKRYESVDQIPLTSRLSDISGLSYFEQKFAQMLDMKSMPEDELIEMQRDYLYLVAWVDEQVGKIAKAVSELDQGRDTIILFNSDHGVSLGDNNAFGKMTFSCCNQRVPLIISHVSGHSGEVETKLCSNIDIARTVLGLAGIEADEQFGGRDLINDGPSDQVFATLGYGGKSSYPLGYDAVGDYKPGMAWPRRACLRKGNFRLDMNVRINAGVVPEGEEDVFFVDRSVCPAENQNMVNDLKYADVIKEMKDELLKLSANSVEVSDEVLAGINEHLKDRSFFQYLLQATAFNDRVREFDE